MSHSRSLPLHQATSQEEEEGGGGGGEKEINRYHLETAASPCEHLQSSGAA